MKAAIFLLIIVLSAIILPVTVNVVETFVAPSVKNFAVLVTSGFSTLVGGGGDELDPIAFPG